jgi:hypothetical protein
MGEKKHKNFCYLPQNIEVVVDSPNLSMKTEKKNENT